MVWMDQRRGIEGDVVFLCLNSTWSWDEFWISIIFVVCLFIWRILFCTQPAGLVNKACAHIISHSNYFVHVKVWEWGFPLKIWHFFSKVASQNRSFSPNLISAPVCPLQCSNLDTMRSQLFKPHQQSIWAAYFMKGTLNNYSVCNPS